MTKLDEIFFVWLPGLSGAQAQIWYGDQVDGSGKPTQNVIFKKKLDQYEQQMSLNALMDRFKDNAKHGIQT